MKKKNKKVEIDESNGLKISYDRDDLNNKFPHLTEEISQRKKSIKIEAIDMNVEQISHQKPQDSNDLCPNELYNPGVIDFLRRCTKIEEAIDILDYLMKRNEINHVDYTKYKNIISHEGGLKQLIDQYGGLKKPGYYMRKYYKKETKNQELNSK
ncbi:MAG: DUF2095 family protein [Promethearchaeota archaeon]